MFPGAGPDRFGLALAMAGITRSPPSAVGPFSSCTPVPNPIHTPPEPAMRRPRWWPALLLCGAAAARWAQIWVLRDYDTQFKLEHSYTVLRLWGPAMLVWWTLLSRLSWHVRLKGWVLLALITGLLTASFRVRGIDGNRLPIVEFRWKSGRTPTLASAASTNRIPAAGPSAAPPLTAFPHFLGPAGNGVLPGPRLATNWSQSPPVELWRQPVGEGWAGFAVEGGDAITLEQLGADEAVVCRVPQTGAVRWIQRYPARYENASAGNGPRTVPTLDADSCWTTGATGMLTCVARSDGHVRWQVQVLRDAASVQPEWGYSVSPLLHEGWIVVAAGSPGGASLVAYDKLTGRRVWAGGTDPVGYSSPVRLTFDGMPQLLLFSHVGVAGHDPATGQVLWSHPTARIPNVTLPLAIDDHHLLVSAGYGYGSELLELQRTNTGAWSVKPVWRSIRMKSKFSNLVARDGYLYGFDDGTFACIRLSDGERVWKEGRYGHGQQLRVDSVTLLTTESGEVVLLDPTPAGPGERTRFRALEGKTWNPPAMAGDLLFLRHDREAVCFRLPTR